MTRTIQKKKKNKKDNFTDFLGKKSFKIKGGKLLSQNEKVTKLQSAISLLNSL